MRILFFSKQKLKVAGMYLLACALLYFGASLFAREIMRPEDTALPTPVLAEAFRNGDENSKNISLAINVDWGNEYIPAILVALSEHNARATFFFTGRWCDENPELAGTIAAAGHEIGNHGYSHTSPNASSKEEIQQEIRQTETAILAATGKLCQLYAPPSGENEPHVLEAAAELGYTTILWSVDTIDWQKPSAATLLERVESKISGGGIILAHPTAPTAEALPQLLTDLQEQGYCFVTVSENLGLPYAP